MKPNTSKIRIQYLGVEAIKGPLIFLDGIEDVANEDLVEIEFDNGSIRQGRVVQIQGKRVAIQVFEGTDGIALNNTKTSFLGHPLELALSPDILGRIFDGAGKPIDGLGPIFVRSKRDINGSPLNPVMREYPRNYINTGISSIDGLITLIRGQKLPIFSGSGLPHNELAAQIVKQASISDKEKSNFCIVFAAMGVKNDVAEFFKKSFFEANVMDRVVMFSNLANDPIIERLLTPRCALTAAEYLAFELHMHVLVIMTDMTAYAEALREFSSSKEEIPGRKGFPGYLYSDLASLYERAGIVKGVEGSVTQIPVLTMPNDDITHPIPDLTGYITEGQVVLDRDLHQRHLFPPIGILPSLSRLMKDGIGDGYTRKDHSAVSNQLFANYAKVLDLRSLASVIGEEELSALDQQYLHFGQLFEDHFINQGATANRTMLETLELSWDLLSLLPKDELNRIPDELISLYYHPQKAQLRFQTNPLKKG